MTGAKFPRLLGELNAEEHDTEEDTYMTGSQILLAFWVRIVR